MNISFKIETPKYFRPIMDKLSSELTNCFGINREDTLKALGRFTYIALISSGFDVIGFCTINVNEKTKVIEIRNVCVPKKYRKQGVARMLLENMIKLYSKNYILIAGARNETELYVKRLSNNILFITGVPRFFSRNAQNLSYDLSKCFEVSEKDAHGALNASTYISLLSKENKTVGFCTLNINDDKKIVEIWNVCVPKDYRRKGFATILLNQLIELFSGIYVLWLIIDKESNIDVYVKQGFVSPTITSETATGKDMKRYAVELIYDREADSEKKNYAREEAARLLKNAKNYNFKKTIQRFEIEPNVLSEIYTTGILTERPNEFGGSVDFDKGKLKLRNIIEGTRRAVSFPCFTMRFHTHPFTAYNDVGGAERRIDIGVNPISDTDLIAETYCLSSLCLIFALEGIYVYQLNPILIPMLKTFKVSNHIAYKMFRESLQKNLSKHVNNIGGEYVVLRDLLNKLYLKHKDILTAVTLPEFISASHKYIFKLLDDYGSIEIEDISRGNKILAEAIKPYHIPSDTPLFFINFTPNVYEQVINKKSVFVNVHNIVPPASL